MSLVRLLRGVARRAAALPLRAVDAQTRVEALDLLSSELIERAPVDGADLKFFVPSTLLRSRVAAMLTKEPDTIAWLNESGPDDIFWDVGANVGVFSVYAAAVRGSRVVAFEPSASNYYMLTRNLQLNDLGQRVTAYCVALSGASGLGVLNLDSAEPGAALSQFGQPGEASRYSANARPLTHGAVSFTIDDFVSRFGVAIPARLKIDVDGLEGPILQGATATLRNPRLRSAIVELTLTNAVERDGALTLMHECGWTLVSVGNPQGVAGEAAANHVFARPA